ncbi:hypothetical protein U2F10_07545 [Leptothoe sp. EHU-05/26/07-4]
MPESSLYLVWSLKSLPLPSTLPLFFLAWTGRVNFIFGLAISRAYAHMDDPILVDDLKKCQLMVQEANNISQTLSVKANPIVSIADDAATGISHTAREQNANLMVSDVTTQLIRELTCSIVLFGEPHM